MGVRECGGAWASCELRPGDAAFSRRSTASWRAQRRDARGGPAPGQVFVSVMHEYGVYGSPD